MTSGSEVKCGSGGSSRGGSGGSRVEAVRQTNIHNVIKYGGGIHEGKIAII